MHAEHFIVCALVIDNRCQRHVLKHIVQLLENTGGVVDVLTKTSITLLAKTQVFIDIAILVISAQHKNLFGVLELERHEQTDNFQTLAAFVNVISQEEVVKTTDVSRLTRGPPNVQESHQVNIVSVNISKNLDWWLQRLNDNGLLLQDICAFINELGNLLPLLSKVLKGCDLLLSLFWLQKFLNKQREQAIVRVFLDEGRFNIGAELFRFLLKFIN